MVDATSVWNCILVFKSARICQSPAVPRSPQTSTVPPLFSLSSDLTKLINLNRLVFGGDLFLAFSRESASTENIWSYRHVYQHSDNATVHNNICSTLAGFPQSLQFGSSDKPRTAFVRLGSTSYTDLWRNCYLFGSIDHTSTHVHFRSLAASRFTQLPCFFMSTVFLHHSDFLLH